MNLGRLAISILVVQLCACASRPDPRVEKARESLIGVRAKRLQKCLGPPTEVAIDGDTERLIFVVTERKRDPRPSEQPSARPDLFEPGTRRPNRTTNVPNPDRAVCELTFEVTKGRVSKVEVSGRRSDGLKDNSCLSDHQICLSGTAE